MGPTALGTAVGRTPPPRLAEPALGNQFLGAHPQGREGKGCELQTPVREQPATEPSAVGLFLLQAGEYGARKLVLSARTGLTFLHAGLRGYFSKK